MYDELRESILHTQQILNIQIHNGFKTVVGF